LVILNNIDFSVRRGERVAIVGVSGSGKSTLLGLLAGLDKPSDGDIVLDGVKLADLDEDGLAKLRAGRVGFVFQDFQLLRSMTALENVALPLEMTQHALGQSDIQQRATAMLTHVGLGHRIYHYPEQLSGGEQQRVAIARAFAAEPDILFADEPTGNLDRDTAGQILDLLVMLNDSRGTTMIIVTHDTRLASRCHRYVELAGGEIINRVDNGDASAVNRS
jgi:putative ABC transport system ATP-binding protein